MFLTNNCKDWNTFIEDMTEINCKGSFFNQARGNVKEPTKQLKEPVDYLYQ